VARVTPNECTKKGLTEKMDAAHQAGHELLLRAQTGISILHIRPTRKMWTSTPDGQTALQNALLQRPVSGVQFQKSNARTQFEAGTRLAAVKGSSWPIAAH
jgi:hypothetical protein